MSMKNGNEKPAGILPDGISGQEVPTGKVCPDSGLGREATYYTENQADTS
jgi:hypothetical protein